MVGEKKEIGEIREYAVKRAFSRGEGQRMRCTESERDAENVKRGGGGAGGGAFERGPQRGEQGGRTRAARGNEGRLAQKKQWIPGQRFLIRLLSGVIKQLTTTWLSRDPEKKCSKACWKCWTYVVVRDHMGAHAHLHLYVLIGCVCFYMHACLLYLPSPNPAGNCLPSSQRRTGPFSLHSAPSIQSNHSSFTVTIYNMQLLNTVAVGYWNTRSEGKRAFSNITVTLWFCQERKCAATKSLGTKLQTRKDTFRCTTL